VLRRATLFERRYVQIFFKAHFDMNRAPVPHSIQRAMQLQKQGKLDKAGEAYEAILAGQPNHFEATHQLGIVRYQQGLHMEALHYLSEAVSLNPADVGVLSNFAVILQSLGQAEEAVATYDKVLAINPDLPEALYNRGNALRELKRPEEALASFDRTTTLKPQFAEAHNNRGNALRELNRPEEALASYDKALAIKPHAARSCRHLRFLLFEIVCRGERAIYLQPCRTWPLLPCIRLADGSLARRAATKRIARYTIRRLGGRY
jgi:tetratricopeptide (TPR) repeat protein